MEYIIFIEDKNLLVNLKNILNIIESKILYKVEKLFDKINFNEIELYLNFTRKMVNFCKRNSKLWKIMLKQNLFEKKESIEEANEIKKKIINEKDYILTISPLKNIWISDEYIKYLDDGLIYIENKTYELDKDQEKKMIKKKSFI